MSRNSAASSSEGAPWTWGSCVSMKSARRFILLRLVKRERERRRGGDAQGWWGNGEVEKRIISEEGEGEGVGVGKKV